MVKLALWLKRNKFRVDQVQTFYPSPMALATAMYHSGRNPLKKLSYKGERLSTAKDIKQRRLHKAFLRSHDEANWELLRDALKQMGRNDLVGDGEHQLIPAAPRTRSVAKRSRANPRRSRSNPARGGQWS